MCRVQCTVASRTWSSCATAFEVRLSRNFGRVPEKSAHAEKGSVDHDVVQGKPNPDLQLRPVVARVSPRRMWTGHE